MLTFQLQTAAIVCGHPTSVKIAKDGPTASNYHTAIGNPSEISGEYPVAETEQLGGSTPTASSGDRRYSSPDTNDSGDSSLDFRVRMNSATGTPSSAR